MVAKHHLCHVILCWIVDFIEKNKKFVLKACVYFVNVYFNIYIIIFPLDRTPPCCLYSSPHIVVQLQMIVCVCKTVLNTRCSFRWNTIRKFCVMTKFHKMTQKRTKKGEKLFCSFRLLCFLALGSCRHLFLFHFIIYNTM